MKAVIISEERLKELIDTALLTIQVEGKIKDDGSREALLFRTVNYYIRVMHDQIVKSGL